MARCFCPCHIYPGTYPPPCGYCGHDTREGRMVGTIRDGWEPNWHAFSPLSGSQDTSGQYTRCGVHGCTLSPAAHPGAMSP